MKSFEAKILLFFFVSFFYTYCLSAQTANLICKKIDINPQDYYPSNSAVIIKSDILNLHFFLIDTNKIDYLEADTWLLNLSPGEHSIMIKAPNGLESNFQVKLDNNEVQAFQIYPDKYYINLFTEPNNANILIENIEKGFSQSFNGPIKNYNLQPGKYSIKISLPGYHTIYRHIMLKHHSILNLSYKLKKLKNNTPKLTVQVISKKSNLLTPLKNLEFYKIYSFINEKYENHEKINLLGFETIDHNDEENLGSNGHIKNLNPDYFLNIEINLEFEGISGREESSLSVNGILENRLHKKTSYDTTKFATSLGSYAQKTNTMLCKLNTCIVRKRSKKIYFITIGALAAGTSAVIWGLSGNEPDKRKKLPNAPDPMY